MYRISNRMMYNNTLLNTFRNNQGLLKAQEQLSSGKRINRPSDDPVGIMEVLQYRTRIGKSEQYLRVMDSAESTLNTADSTIGSIHDILKRTKELALQQAGGLASAESRITAAQDIDNLVAQTIQFGNTKVGSRFIFAGQSSDAPALSGAGKYDGSPKDLKVEISEGTEISISVKASDFLAADMNAAISSTDGATLLSSLNGGAGVTAGVFSITDRSGASANITITAPMAATGDVEDVITAINGSGLNITASVSADGTALVLTDSTSPPTAPITVASNATSQSLGIDGSRNTSTFTGDDLDPDVTGETLISSLYGGKGLTLDNIVLKNGSASATVTLSAQTTVQQVITAINLAGAPINVSASIDSAGRTLNLASSVASTVAYAEEEGNGSTAELLGIGGGRNVIKNLQLLSSAMRNNDAVGILGVMGLLDEGMDTVSSARGFVGAKANQVSVTRGFEDQAVFDNTRVKSQIEDADMIAAASELVMLQTAYQATLKASAAIIQPSLLDFI